MIDKLVDCTAHVLDHTNTVGSEIYFRLQSLIAKIRHFILDQLKLPCSLEIVKIVRFMSLAHSLDAEI